MNVWERERERESQIDRYIDRETEKVSLENLIDMLHYWAFVVRIDDTTKLRTKHGSLFSLTVILTESIPNLIYLCMYVFVCACIYVHEVVHSFCANVCYFYKFVNTDGGNMQRNFECLYVYLHLRNEKFYKNGLIF